MTIQYGSSCDKVPRGLFGFREDTLSPDWQGLGGAVKGFLVGFALIWIEKNEWVVVNQLRKEKRVSCKRSANQVSKGERVSCERSGRIAGQWGGALCSREVTGFWWPSVVSIVPCLLYAVLLCTSPLLLQSHSNDACACGCWNTLSLVDITNNSHQTMELCRCKTSPHSTWGKIQLKTESCKATRWWWRFSGILQLKAAYSGHGAISPLFLLCQPQATMPGCHSSQIKWNKNHQGLKSLHWIIAMPFRT